MSDTKENHPVPAQPVRKVTWLDGLIVVGAAAIVGGLGFVAGRFTAPEKVVTIGETVAESLTG